MNEKPGLDPGFFFCGTSMLYEQHFSFAPFAPYSTTTPDHNPYSAPSSNVGETKHQKRPRKAAPVKGLFVGLAVDIGGSACLGMLTSFVYAMLATASGQSVEQITAYLTHPPHDSWLYIFGMVMGSALSFAGGYAGACVAQRHEYRVGALQCLLSVGFGLWAGSRDFSFGMQISLSGLTILLIMLGVKLGVQRNQRIA